MVAYLALLAVSAVIILVLFYMGWNCCGEDHERYIRGMWRADDAFCEESGVSSMLLYIGEERGGRRVVRDGYLIINNDVCNQRITLEYGRPRGSWGSLGKYRIRADVQYDEDPVMPESDLCFEFDMAEGSLRVYQGEKMYGVFYKDHELTNLSRATD